MSGTDMVCARSIDIVFALDASEVMQPVIDALASYIGDFLRKLSRKGVADRPVPLRVGLIAGRVVMNGGKWLCQHVYMNGRSPENTSLLYRDGNEDMFFTKPIQQNGEEDALCRRLYEIRCGGKANMPLILDRAADFPFRSKNECKRILIAISDKEFDQGAFGMIPMGVNWDVLAKVMHKITVQRDIWMVGVFPEWSSSEFVGEFARTMYLHLPKREILSVREVTDWFNDEFEQYLLMACSDMASDGEAFFENGERYGRAIYGQDAWCASQWTDGDAVELDGVDAGQADTQAMPGTAMPVQCEYIFRLIWHQSFDMDLHAFILCAGGTTCHVWFGDRSCEFLKIDFGQGVGCMLNADDLEMEGLGVPRVYPVNHVTDVEPDVSNFNLNNK